LAVSAVKIAGYVFLTTIGGPQGEILSPDLFTMETDDMIVDKVLQLLVKFADDSTVVASVSNEQELDEYQESINDIIRQCKEKGLILNADKTKEIIVDFSRDQRITSSLPRTTMNGVAVERVTCEKLLGYQLTEDLKPHKHAEYRIKQANQRLFLLYRLKKLGLPRSLLSTFYEQGIRSILESASPVFHHALTVEDTEKFERIQRRAERCINDNNVRVSLAARRQAACDKHFEKLINQESPLLPGRRKKENKRSASYVVDGQFQNPPTYSTKRYLSSFIPAQARVYNDSLNVNSTIQKRTLIERKEGKLYSQKQ
jgi:hypothetical protein